MGAVITIEESQKFVAALNNLGLVVIDKQVLDNLLIEVNLKTRVDKRNSYLTKKEVLQKYNVTRYWLEERLKDPETLIKYDPGKGKTSTGRYNEQSIIKELDRLAM
ncbi:hypothetical protein ACQY1Q_05940 [Tenacibaculum sp. TC6]|uniref:hypothetical protein n=1 Tax=Tenacibaculum sp. TC6 TaxID=3423223 RepID=UPI003D36F243